MAQAMVAPTMDDAFSPRLVPNVVWSNQKADGESKGIG